MNRGSGTEFSDECSRIDITAIDVFAELTGRESVETLKIFRSMISSDCRSVKRILFSSKHRRDRKHLCREEMCSLTEYV